MKLHLLQKLFSLIACIYLASLGQCQEKAKEATLTASQKEEVLKADLIYKEMLENFEKNEFAKATALAIQALKTYRDLLGNQHSKTHKTIIDLGRLYLYQKEYAKSEPLLLEALKLNREIEGNKHPDTAGSLVDLAELYADQAQYSKAEPLLIEALKIRKETLGNKHPDTEDCIDLLVTNFLNNAVEHFANNDSKSAVSKLTQLISLDPNRPEGYDLRGIMYHKIKNTQKAITDFTKAIELDPKFYHAYNNRGRVYTDQKMYSKAIADFTKAIQLNPKFYDAYNNRGRVYTDQKMYSKAIADFSKAIELDPKFYDAYNNRGRVYTDQKMYSEAITDFTKAIELNPKFYDAYNNRGRVYTDQKMYSKAIADFSKAIELDSKEPNAFHNRGLTYIAKQALSDAIPDLISAARKYKNNKDYFEAEQLYIKLVDLSIKEYGNKHIDTIDRILALARFYHRELKLLSKAEILYNEALKIISLAEDNEIDYFLIGELGLFYLDIGIFSKAESFLLKKLKLTKEGIKGEVVKSWLAVDLGNLALLYSKQGLYSKAEPLYIESLDIHKKEDGINDLYTIIAMTDLAVCYTKQSLYSKAEPLFLESLKICKDLYGPDDHETVEVSLYLANFYRIQGLNFKAESICLEVTERLKEIYGDNHIKTADGLFALASIYNAQGFLSKSQPLFLEALKVARDTWGHKNFNTVEFTSGLADSYKNQQLYSKAEPLYIEALDITTFHLQSSAIIQNEFAQIQMNNEHKRLLNDFLTNALLANLPASSGYEQVLTWKGMIFRRQNLLRALQGNDPLKKKLREIISQFANLLNSDPKPDEIDQYEANVKSLSGKKEELEKELAKQIPSLNLTKVTPSDLRNSITPDVALIDIFQYEHFFSRKDKLYFEPLYAAWVIRKDKPIVRLELGSSKDIDDLVFEWRSSLSTRKSPSEGPQDPALALREKVWLPIAKHLDGAKTVIISPDGALGTLPFTALPGEDIKKYLIEERNIAVVPFLQTLPDLLAKKESTGIASMLALGDVAYDVEAIIPSNSTSSLLAVRGEKGAKWNRLPGTKAEVLSIENSFRKYFPSGSLVELNLNKASEQSVRESAPKSRYLHFATHGFFADETVKAMAAKQGDNKKMMGEKVVVTGENPGLLSGLVLAGANLPPKGNGDDGILTASEVAELDLTGVELAILSACETGLGKTAGGEGIFGLQRAFQLAGARTVVASSWKVPDLSTKELMVRFYGNLWEKKMGKLEALREAQLWVMKEGKAAGLDRGIYDESVAVKDTKKEPVKVVGSTKGEMLPPKYWAAWILSGAWN